MSSYFTDILNSSPLCEVIIDDGKDGKLIKVSTDGTPTDSVAVSLESTNDGVKVSLSAGETPISYVLLRYKVEFPAGTLLFGDEWERGYGTMHWGGIHPEHRMPWYFAVYDRNARILRGYGVKVRPHSMCVWSADGAGITLCLDVRSRGRGVILGDRKLEAAEIVSAEYKDTDAFSALSKFCHLMSQSPRLPQKPVYGFNNWYYAYGNSSREDILTDSKLLAELTEGLENRPYMAIDDGWEIYDNGVGMWSGGNKSYGDMAKLASDMENIGVIPGIWVRPLKENDGVVPDEWYVTHHGSERYLDPTIPEVLEKVKSDIRKVRSWGYRLIKHDFTSYDLFGIWGKDMGYSVTRFNDSFKDRSITSAEAVINLYTAIREAADDAVIIGCNTFSHLSAGLFELCRVGDDTSGRAWERTRRMGVNSMAFRLPQNGAFYMNDADCVGHISRDLIPWELNSKWLKLVAESGSPLFVSCDPKTADEEIKNALKAAFAINSKQTDSMQPLDWLDNSCPREWLINGEKMTFDWHDEFGYNPITDTKGY